MLQLMVQLQPMEGRVRGLQCSIHAGDASFSIRNAACSRFGGAIMMVCFCRRQHLLAGDGWRLLFSCESKESPALGRGRLGCPRALRSAAAAFFAAGRASFCCCGLLVQCWRRLVRVDAGEILRGSRGLACGLPRRSRDVRCARRLDLLARVCFCRRPLCLGGAQYESAREDVRLWTLRCGCSQPCGLLWG